MFLWRSLQPDALTVLLDYLARRGKAPASTDPACARPLAADGSPERPEPVSR